jgi:SulP family sulfate permease
VPAVDSTGISALETFLKQTREHGVKLILSELQSHPRKTLEKAGFVKALSHDYIVPTMYDALDLADDLIEESRPIIIKDNTGVMLRTRAGRIKQYVV